MSESEPRQHAWVKHTVTPVQVIADPDSVEGFYAFDFPLDDAKPMEVYGCNVCSVPLNHDTVNSSCEKAIQLGGNFSVNG